MQTGLLLIHKSKSMLSERVQRAKIHFVLLLQDAAIVLDVMAHDAIVEPRPCSLYCLVDVRRGGNYRLKKILAQSPVYIVLGDTRPHFNPLHTSHKIGICLLKISLG